MTEIKTETQPVIQTHSKNFNKVKYFYEEKLWNKIRVYNVVNKWITEHEYEEITKEKYELK